MAKQLTLFDKPKKQPEPLTFTAPVCEGDHLSVHGLIYSTEPVEGWLEAKWLDIYRPPHKKRIADRAWIRPDTIASVCIQEYAEINEKFKKEGRGVIPPIAWGFGPSMVCNRRDREMGRFDFADPGDYEQIEEILERERDKHNRWRADELTEGGSK